MINEIALDQMAKEVKRQASNFIIPQLPLYVPGKEAHSRSTHTHSGYGGRRRSFALIVSVYLTSLWRSQEIDLCRLSILYTSYRLRIPYTKDLGLETTDSEPFIHANVHVHARAHTPLCPPMLGYIGHLRGRVFPGRRGIG